EPVWPDISSQYDVFWIEVFDVLMEGSPGRGRRLAARRRTPDTLAVVSTTRTAAQLLVECLAEERCEYVFSVPGEETMDILDALGRAAAAGSPGSPTHITTRHEQGAAFMADVYGRLTGRAAVAMATLGPGATNLVTGVADAHLDRAPMVAITGQAGSDKLHKDAHQVVAIVRIL